MAALITDERCFVFSYLYFLLANENGAGYIRDLCCHLLGDRAAHWSNALVLVDAILTRNSSSLLPSRLSLSAKRRVLRLLPMR